MTVMTFLKAERAPTSTLTASTATDRYGNWTTRQDYRALQSFGKSSEVLDGQANRKISYG